MQEDGSYAGFDDKELTSRSGGKAAAARLIKVKISALHHGMQINLHLQQKTKKRAQHSECACRA